MVEIATLLPEEVGRTFRESATKNGELFQHSKSQIKSNFSLYWLDYAEACNELAGPISASLRLDNKAPFEEMSQRWRAVGNTVSDLTGPRFEPQTSRSIAEHVTARPPDKLI